MYTVKAFRHCSLLNQLVPLRSTAPHFLTSSPSLARREAATHSEEGEVISLSSPSLASSSLSASCTVCHSTLSWRARVPFRALPTPRCATYSRCGDCRGLSHCLWESVRPFSTATAMTLAPKKQGSVDETATAAPKKRGRPKGSLNKPKSTAIAPKSSTKKSSPTAVSVEKIKSAALAEKKKTSVGRKRARDEKEGEKGGMSAGEEEKARDTEGDEADDEEGGDDYGGHAGASASLPPQELHHQTSQRLQLPLRGVRYVLEQTQQGATVPFLARYRQGETGRLDETQLRAIIGTAKEVAEVHRRRQFMLKSLEDRGLLTPALQRSLEKLVHVSQLEDAWEPYKERRTSLASRGREAGLGPLAHAILHFAGATEEESGKLLLAAKAAVAAVEDGERLCAAIVAEEVQRCEEVRVGLLDYCRQTGRLTSQLVTTARKKVAKDLRDDDFDKLKKHFSFYDGRSWSVQRVAGHILLALQRGENKGVLAVELTPGGKSHGIFMDIARRHFPGVEAFFPFPPPPRSAATEQPLSPLNPRGSLSYARRLLHLGLTGAYEHTCKAANLTVRRDLKKGAEKEAIIVFAHNLEQMLLQRPMAHSRLLAMDPGLANGVKCVTLDEAGAVMSAFKCTLMDDQKMSDMVAKVVEERKINKVVIGNGTASHQTAELVARLIEQRGWRQVEFAVVSEAGASVYSVSDIAKEEFPTLDIMYRGAVSIGRRVLDPLSELVKIPVRSMGIGMYQHDLNEKELTKELHFVVESCVARVGVNVSYANRYVMEKVPGVQKKLVDQITLARHARKLVCREDLRRVPGMTEPVFQQIAGFFRFPNSTETLDNTRIHPESYPVVRQLVRLQESGELATLALRVIAEDSACSATQRQASIAAVQEAMQNSRAAQDLGLSPAPAAVRGDAAAILAALSSSQMASLVSSAALSTDPATLELVREELQNPGLDPRASLPHAGLLRRTVRDAKDLKRGDVLSGVVQSVTMFGAFVDCGLHDAVLVRGEGVDRVQIGAHLQDAIVFESLDQLGRPRVRLLSTALPSGQPHREAGKAGAAIHMESADQLTSTSPSLHGRGGGEERSLRAHVAMERARREEGTTIKTTGAGVARSLPTVSPLTPAASVSKEEEEEEVFLL